jgi:lipopolysaccharide biosynthesis glycosyltransferase
MNILVATDRNYLQYAYVMLVSLLENNKDSHVDIFCIHYDIDDISIKKFKRFFSRYDATVTFIKYDVSRIIGLKTGYHFTHAMYLKVICPELLPKTVTKILYLDPDIIVTKPLADLYNTDLGGCFLGAVEDFNFDNRNDSSPAVPNRYAYFNSGVMLIDLDKFRSHDVSKQVMDYAVNHRETLVWPDQDALNAVLREKRFPLHHRWNFYRRPTANNKSPSAAEGISTALSDPAIIHYVGSVKPWHHLCDHPLKWHYWRYVKKTPYRYSQPFRCWYEGTLHKSKVRIASLMQGIILRLSPPLRRLIPRLLADRLKRTIPPGR